MSARAGVRRRAALGDLRCAIAALGAALLLCGFAVNAPLQAQSSGGLYTLSAHAIAGGGLASGGIFVLEGSVGQQDAGGPHIGGAFELNGGFHRRAPGVQGGEIFEDGFE